ncbi:integrase family protein [Ruminiclostridium papyrosolvens DSM 2782]|uniref:Integrase family protein n=1 Tax=Ruminiclostridium papyrosolvens DSM 2782 TaxID=588581 RepID=F1TD59_9FIRM|nr:tyrosine recombinase XerC [Ruminiclostridium papyrosolvens]EGD47497.1 integrase family protein [Ruminiclostridium papyrosolvens DSM 2782]WES36553.1 tyrosine recombinase XerC [Ruminiclostridium papyrosolvens DSM 2782]
MKNIYDFEMPAVLRDFLNYMQTIKGKSINTIQVYFYDLRIFFRFLKIHRNIVDKNLEFDTIEITDIDIPLLKTVTLSDLYTYMSFVSNKRDNTSHARARKVASLKSFFNYLSTKAKLLDINPTIELESPKILKRLPRYLNFDESKKLLTSVTEANHEYSVRDYAIITIFLNCGIRLSELVGINLYNIKDNTLTVFGKGGKERSIPLNKACLQAIEDYMKIRPVNGLKDKSALFISRRNQRISKESVQKIVKRYIKEAGLDPQRYSTHKLRHTAATLMYKYGNVDIRALQEILGHESISTTEIYTHLDQQQLKEAVNKHPLSDFSVNIKM